MYLIQPVPYCLGRMSAARGRRGCGNISLLLILYYYYHYEVCIQRTLEQLLLKIIKFIFESKKNCKDPLIDGRTDRQKVILHVTKFM